MEHAPLFSKKQLFSLLWPLIVEQLLAVFVGMVDVLMVATLGEAAVSGVSLVDAINNLVIQVLFAATAGGTVVCAQYIGAKKAENASHSGAQLFLITITGTCLVTAIFLAAGNHILALIFGSVEPAVMKNASVYIYLTALSFPFLALYNSGAAIFRAKGNTRVSMLVSLFMNFINIGGNAFCLFVLKMGVAGVAVPTVAARAIAAFTILFLLQKPENEIRIRSLQDLKPHFPTIKRILAIGIPNSVESGLFQFGKLTLQSLVSTLGTASIAAYAVASNLVTYLYLPGNALGAGMITVTGQCWGANEKGQARHYAKVLILINYAMLAVLSSTLIAGRGFFIRCYNLSADSASLAGGLVLIHSIGMIIWPVAFLLPYYFRATGRASFTMIVAISTMWIFRIGLAYVFVRLLHMNVLGVWYAMMVDWVVRVIVYVIAFRSDKKRIASSSGA